MRVIRRIDHLGIAVKDLESALGLWRDHLGLEVTFTEVVESQKVKVAALAVGESRIELLEPTDPESPVARFIEGRGEGVHHVALAVDDIGLALQEARAAGLRLIDESPRRGAGGALIAFLHPKSTGGVLVELCQHD